MGSIDPSSELVGLVVIVKVVLELGSQQDWHQEHLVDVEVVESEVLEAHVVPVYVDDGYDQAFCWKFGVLMEPFDELEEGHGGDAGGVEDRHAGATLLLDQIHQ
jgi:hypothetical protein